MRNTAAAQLWANCISSATKDGLCETNRFYHFPNQESLGDYLSRLMLIIEKLKRHHPTLDFPEIDLDNIQKSVNNLHFNFAHSHHVTKLVNEINHDDWRVFNVLLHAIEFSLMTTGSKQMTGLETSRIVFTWNSAHKVLIPDECYDDFFLGYDFGTVYANYSQIGRHFVEMFFSGDDSLADEHIEPSRFISADTSIWLGPTTGHYYTKDLNRRIEIWFEKRKERFNRLGYFWNDKKLALGRIPVARLTDLLYTKKEIEEFVEKVSRFNIVESAYVD